MSTELAPIEQTTTIIVPSGPGAMLTAVLQAMSDPNIDPGRLERFLAIGRELEADQAKRNFIGAFLAAKDEMDGLKIKKNGKIVYEGKNGKPDSIIKFLKYDDIADVVKPILAKHDLAASYTFEFIATPPKTVCVMELLHKDGHSKEYRSVPMPMVDSGGGKSDIQGAGSVGSYGKRYVVCPTFDIVAEDEDDDGSGKNSPVPLTDIEVQTIHDVVGACEGREAGFTKRFSGWMLRELKVADPKMLYRHQLKIVMDKLNDKQRDLGLLR